MACEVDPENGAIHVVEAGYRYDLTDVPPTLLDTFRECGICLDDLEAKLEEAGQPTYVKMLEQQ